jgi:hypothetical protein
VFGVHPLSSALESLLALPRIGARNGHVGGMLLDLARPSDAIGAGLGNAAERTGVETVFYARGCLDQGSVADRVEAFAIEEIVPVPAAMKSWVAGTTLTRVLDRPAMTRGMVYGFSTPSNAAATG